MHVEDLFTFLTKKISDLSDFISTKIKGFSVAPANAQITKLGDLSFFHLLVKTPADLKVLNRLLDDNSQLKERITADFLCAQINCSDKSYLNTSILYDLFKSFAGIAILKKLFDANSELKESIMADALLSSTYHVSVF